MKQMKITAILLDGRIVTNDGCLPLDGILSRAIILKDRPDLIGKPMSDFSEYISLPLPIKKINPNTEDWYYACSYAFFKKIGEDRSYYNKRYDETEAERFVDFGKKKGSVDTCRGKYKNYRYPINVVLTKEINWYCLPDSDKSKEKIEQLLLYVKNIGKKPSQGFGIISEWKVSLVEETEKLYLMRPIPSKDGMQEKTIRPPYFDLSNSRRVLMPPDQRLGCNQMYKGAAF